MDYRILTWIIGFLLGLLILLLLLLISEDKHATFTPLCISIDGLMGTELNCFVKRMAQCLAIKWDRPLNTTLYWVRAKLSFSLIRAVNLCIRGSRHKWQGIGMDDGFGINPTFLT